MSGDVNAGPNAEMFSAIEIRQVITRACARCSAPRNPQNPAEPCANCGLDTPAVQDDNGLVAAVYRDPDKQNWWTTAGSRLAAARIAATNRLNEARKR